MTEQLTINIVKRREEADPDAICVTIFEEGGRLLGWFLGPAEFTRKGLRLPYMPRSARQEVAAAVTTAMVTALVAHRNICIVDPHELWALV